ncbi:epoxide hydrolase family protein [Pedobacter hiemivivus]|uniref:epoxide hydrolase family protein n=1 Tax=Pedobacter hiemivivus TaxID=2530454 RepID=UPI0019818DE4|nr:epoxide hydrolase family protein [Pedobacter hiemivivus]
MENTNDNIDPTESTQIIRPFQFQAAQADLDDLKRRILAAKFPEKETVTDNSQGVPLVTIEAIATYWANNYDWHKIEAKLNSYSQFITEIDGLDIHFIHVKSKHENALPVIITHGWPGTIMHNLKIIDPLTNPTAYGGKAEDAFHVVIPSLPGFGFSGKPTTTGWGPDRIGRAWVTLMNRLGYDKFFAQGGDWGAIITEIMAAESPDKLLGIHTNMPNAVPADLDTAAFSGAPTPSGLSAEEKGAYERLSFTYKNVNYAYYMRSRPQTLVGLADSPVGMVAFMVDFDPRGLLLIERLFAGVSEGLSRDDVLDNFTLFWLTNTAVSAARIYWENKFSFFVPKGVSIPVAVSVYPDEIYPAPRTWVEKAYFNLIYYNKVPKGGHFPAWEQPKLFIEELRAAFKSLRKEIKKAI